MEKTVLQMSISLTSNYQLSDKDRDCGQSTSEQTASVTTRCDGEERGHVLKGGPRTLEKLDQTSAYFLTSQ